MEQQLDREMVHQALECLYDNVALSRAGLVSHFPQLASLLAMDERAEVLRSTLLEAIEALRPPRRVSFGALESRGYDVLTLRYVEGMSIERMEAELSVGRRQIYRDLDEAKAKLAELLGSWVESGFRVSNESQGRDSLSDELLALSADPARVELGEVLLEATAMVETLAERNRTQLSRDADVPGFVLADRSILRQVLVQILSAAVQAAGSRVDLAAAEPDPARVTISVRFLGSVKGAQERRLGDIQRIAASQGMAFSWTQQDGGVEAKLTVDRGTPVSILVVEDNPGALELYRRYLSPRAWQVHSVADPRVALEVARRTLPDVIVLDIMMPKLDGWSVLQSLRREDATRDIPVLVCSIVEDPELADALGAQACLTKPVSQGEFLAAVRRCLASTPS